MENIPIFDTEEEINSRMQDYSLIQEDYESIPDYLQYDPSQGSMFEPTFLSDNTYISPGNVPRQGIPFTDEFYNSSAPFNVDGPINIPGQNRYGTRI